MASPIYAKAGYWYWDNKFPTPVASIPSQHFTHPFAAFVDVNATTGYVPFPASYQVQFSNFTQNVQKDNEHVQTLLSIGGEVSPPIFASLARSNNFHGLSLPWLCPFSMQEMTNFGSLLREWRRAVDLEPKSTGNDPLLLVAAVCDKPKYRGFYYPVDDIYIKNSSNWINVSAYDYYSPSSSPALPGLFAAILCNEQADKANCGDTGVSDRLQKSTPPKQIVLGLPFYGYMWLLKNGITARADGPDKEVPPDGAAAHKCCKCKANN
jgi:chitinase